MWLREAGGGEDVVQARAEIEVRAGAQHGLHDAVRDALAGGIRAHDGHHPRFLEGDDATGAELIDQRGERRGGVGLIAKHEAADDGVERRAGNVMRQVGLLEGDVGHARIGHPPAGVIYGVGIDIDADDHPGGSDHFAKQDADVAGARSEIEHAQPRRRCRPPRTDGESSA